MNRAEGCFAIIGEQSEQRPKSLLSSTYIEYYHVNFLKDEVVKVGRNSVMCNKVVRGKANKLTSVVIPPVIQPK